jgi:hypothetical protein
VLLERLKPEMPCVMEVVYAKDLIFEKGRLRTIHNNTLFSYLFKNDLCVVYFVYVELFISMYQSDDQNTLLKPVGAYSAPTSCQQ